MGEDGAASQAFAYDPNTLVLASENIEGRVDRAIGRTLSRYPPLPPPQTRTAAGRC